MDSPGIRFVCQYMCEFSDNKCLSHSDGCTLHSASQSAQYCTYTTREHDSRDIVHISTVDKRKPDRNSVIMEECFMTIINALLQEIPVKEMVTDAPVLITALVGKENRCIVWIVVC